MLRGRNQISVKVDEKKLKRRNRELALILDLSNLLASSFSMRGVLEGSLSRLLEHFDLGAGRIYLMTEGGNEMELAAHHGIDPGGLERVSVDAGFSGKAVKTRSFIAQRVSDLEDPKRAAFLSSKGLNTILCTPLISRDRVLGVMNLATDREPTLKADSIDLLMAAGNQIAVAVDNVRLYEDLRAKVVELTEKRDMIKHFAYSVSHDLKSPAVSLYGLTKRFLEKYAPTLDEKGREYGDHILKCAEEMLALVETINAYMAAKEAPLNFQSVPMRDIAEATEKEFSADLKDRHVRWRSDDLPEMVGDRMALTRVFRNLVDNALKYGGPDLSEIHVRYRENGEHHILSFSDNGQGIDAEDREKLFEVFNRTRTASGIAGSGLGLSIVREIAERHSGCVWLDTDTPRGATFHVAISKHLRSQ